MRTPQDTFHDGFPPFRHWWWTEANGYLQTQHPRFRALRWFDGQSWSVAGDMEWTAEIAGKFADRKAPTGAYPIRWSWYWPENAKVQRIDPRPVSARAYHNLDILPYLQVEPGWITRLKAERAELQERYQKLGAFLAIRRPAFAPGFSKTRLMMSQEAIMAAYLNVLEHRLALATKQGNWDGR